MAALLPLDIAHSDCIHKLLWSETYDNPANDRDEAHGVAVDADGNIVVVGYENRPDLDQRCNWRIRKYDPAGSLLWSNDYNITPNDNEFATGIAVDANGNIVVVGDEIRTDINQRVNWRIRKYDPNGNLLWGRDYNSPANDMDQARGVAIDAEGNIVVGGYENRPDLDQDWNWRIRKYDPDGELLWSKAYNGPASERDSVDGIAVDTSGNIVVVGYEYRSDLGEDSNWRIRKYSPSGTLIWSQDYNSPANGEDSADGVAVDAGGNIVIVGYEYRPDLDEDFNWRIRKYDPDGNLLWSEDYSGGPFSKDIAGDVAVAASGIILIVGSEFLPELLQRSNWRIRQYDPNGNLLWNQGYNSPANEWDEAHEVAVDARGNFVVVGYENRPDLGQDRNWRILKYACPVGPPEIPMEIPKGPHQGTLRVFPNPYSRSDAVRGTVKFEGLDLGSQVRIYTIRGLLVWEGVVEQPHILEWNGRNEAGKPVAPGTYLWIAESVTGKERGSLIVE